MPKIDAYELEVLTAFEKGQLKSVATKAELAKLKAARALRRSRIAGSTSACPLAI
jgi:hypothetical protein